MRPADFRPTPLAGCPGRWVPPTRSALSGSWSCVRRALPPTTPGSLLAASARCFASSARPPILWEEGHFHVRNEAESGSLALRPTPSIPRLSTRSLPRGSLPRLPRRGHPHPRPGDLHVERANHMVSSFQLTSTARLRLTYQRRKDAKRNPLGPIRISLCGFAALREILLLVARPRTA